MLPSAAMLHAMAEPAQLPEEMHMQSMEDWCQWNLQMAAWHAHLVALGGLPLPEKLPLAADDPVSVAYNLAAYEPTVGESTAYESPSSASDRSSSADAFEPRRLPLPSFELPITPPPGLGFEEVASAPTEPSLPPVMKRLLSDASSEASPLAAMGVSVERLEDGSQCVWWAVPAKFLSTRDKSAVSPEISIELPGLGPQPFRIALYPIAKGEGKGAGSFKRAKGQGKIELKCGAQLPKNMSAPVAVCFGVGQQELQQPARGPVTHDFCERSACRLPCGTEAWSFASAVDASNMFTVSLFIASS